jgi:hypothetical protein
LTAWAAFLSLSASHSVMHIIYIYIYTDTLCVYRLIGRRPSMYKYMFVRPVLLFIISFSFCAQYTICQTSSCTIYIYIYIYVYIYTTHIQCSKLKRRFEERVKDCSIIYRFFLSFFLPFLFWRIANW